MSFMMDLPPEVETRLQAEASRQGVPPAAVALRLVADNLPKRGEAEQFAQWVSAEKPDADEAEQKRLASIAALIGKYAHLDVSTDALRRERQADTEREDRGMEGFAP